MVLRVYCRRLGIMQICPPCCSDPRHEHSEIIDSDRAESNTTIAAAKETERFRDMMECRYCHKVFSKGEHLRVRENETPSTVIAIADLSHRDMNEAVRNATPSQAITRELRTDKNCRYGCPTIYMQGMQTTLRTTRFPRTP